MTILTYSESQNCKYLQFGSVTTQRLYGIRAEFLKIWLLFSYPDEGTVIVVVEVGVC